jgi:hypothetical protein
MRYQQQSGLNLKTWVGECSKKVLLVQRIAGHSGTPALGPFECHKFSVFSRNKSHGGISYFPLKG